MKSNFVWLLGFVIFSTSDLRASVASPTQQTMAALQAEIKALDTEAFFKPTTSRYFGIAPGRNPNKIWREFTRKDKNTRPVMKSMSLTAIVNWRPQHIIRVAIFNDKPFAQPTAMQYMFRHNGSLVQQVTLFNQIRTPRRTSDVVVDIRYYDSAGRLAYSKTTYRDEKTSHSDGAPHLRMPLPNDALQYVRKHIIVYKHASDLPFYNLLKKPKPG